MIDKEIQIKNRIEGILLFIGEDINREGLKETPKRVAKMYDEIFAGYSTPCPDLKTFTSTNNSMIVKTGITVFSCCEHHMVPMKLHIDFAYVPAGKVVGISKIIRLAKWCAARLTLQEDLTEMIVNEFTKQVNPKGCMCVIRGHHFCEEMRGVRTENLTQTSAIRGIFEKLEVRTEALSLMHHGE